MIQAVIENTNVHTPVMVEEVLRHLSPGAGDVILDCTLGNGGHARAILEMISPQGRLVGIDQDGEILSLARENLSAFPDCTLIQDNFLNLDRVLQKLKIPCVNGVLFDLGVSAYHFNQAHRGFSFTKDGPLDMRMNQERTITAFDLVNYLPQDELAHILKTYGQERWSGRIARTIVKFRAASYINSTVRLAEIIARSVPYSFKRTIHPATRTFQALRIAVNRELEVLPEALEKAMAALAKGGRICVISFHSLEDRIVKNEFHKFARQQRGKIITPKPLSPTLEEITRNIRSRSAKLRVIERI